MFCSFTPFIQFVAAIYLSMCFDGMLSKFFWNSDYAEKLDRIFSRIDALSLGSEREKAIRGILKGQETSFFEKVKKRSLLLLIICIAILLWSGVEPIVISNSSICLVVTGGILVILLPIMAIKYYCEGKEKTKKEVDKIEKYIGAQISRFYNIQESIVSGKKIDDADFNSAITELISGSNEDTIDKNRLFPEAQDMFREKLIKNIIEKVEQQSI